MVEESSNRTVIKFCARCKTRNPSLTSKGYFNWCGYNQTGNYYCSSCWKRYIKPELHSKIKCACGNCEELIPSINKGGKQAKYKLGHNPSKSTLKKGGKYINSLGYILILLPAHPYANKDGYVLEHRIIIEKHLGRYLQPDELIHHINKNRQDNRIENLQIVTRAKHASIHNILEHYQFKLGHKTNLGKKYNKK